MPRVQIDHSPEAPTVLRTVPIVLPHSRTQHVRSMALTYASIVVVLVGAVGLIWAATATLTIVVTAQGKIAPVGRVQVVAHAEGGTVRALNVRLGQYVKAGETLIELDATAATADFKKLENELRAHEAAIRRLEAEQLNQVPDLTDFQFELAQSETNLSNARQALYSWESTAARGELESAKAVINAAQAGLIPIRERLDGRRKLEQTGFGSRFNVLEDEAKIADLMGRSAAGQASEKIAAANIKAVYHRREKEIAESTIAHRNRHSELSNMRPNILSRLENLSVLAPVNGIVKSISVSGPGAVLKPGEALAEIVPESGERLVVALLPAADIGYVHPGQSAQLALIPSDMHFKPIDGTVQMLAPDSVADERTGQLNYIVQIKPELDRFMARNGGDAYPLGDGVPVSVTIVTGERTILGILVGPLFAGLEQALGVR